VGGTILTTALAVLAARGEKPVASTTLLTTLLDFSDTGILDVFIDENMVQYREMQMGKGGLLPGSDPRLRDETILVTSHYDHLGVQGGALYPGANDNGSGTVAMLEVARLLAAAPPARSVLFVSFGSEEQLMLGSYHYVARPLRPLATTRAVLNLDMIGRNEEHTAESTGAYDITAGQSDQLNLVGASYSPDLAGLLRREAAGPAGLRLSDKFDRDSSMRALFRCDHLPFLQKGIPAVWLFGGFHPGYHEPADTVDRIDFEKMARTVRLTVDAVRALGTTPAPPAFRYPARP
jgi:Zn-dependent M28 family amino/carboxypeptidase